MKLRSTKYKFPLFAGLTGILLQSYLFIYGCSAPANYPVSSEKTLYSAKCASCHRLLPPEDYTTDVWQDYVVKYGKQMTEFQRQELLNYLQKNAADSISEDNDP